MKLHIKLFYIYYIQFLSCFILFTRGIYKVFYFLFNVQLRTSPSFLSVKSWVAGSAFPAALARP